MIVSARRVEDGELRGGAFLSVHCRLRLVGWLGRRRILWTCRGWVEELMGADAVAMLIICSSPGPRQS